jgi:hypothetical protein
MAGRQEFIRLSRAGQTVAAVQQGDQAHRDQAVVDGDLALVSLPIADGRSRIAGVAQFNPDKLAKPLLGQHAAPQGIVALATVLSQQLSERSHWREWSIVNCELSIFN